jgi:hypothetical protein
MERCPCTAPGMCPLRLPMNWPGFLESIMDSLIAFLQFERVRTEILNPRMNGQCLCGVVCPSASRLLQTRTATGPRLSQEYLTEGLPAISHAVTSKEISLSEEVDVCEATPHDADLSHPVTRYSDPFAAILPKEPFACAYQPFPFRSAVSENLLKFRRLRREAPSGRQRRPKLDLELVKEMLALNPAGTRLRCQA